MIFLMILSPTHIIISELKNPISDSISLWNDKETKK